MSAKGYVYLVSADYSGPIKIGYTTNPRKRLRSLQVASPGELQFDSIFEATVEVEKDLHSILSEARLNGEWFERDAVMTLIDELGDISFELGGLTPPQAIYLYRNGYRGTPLETFA